MPGIVLGPGDKSEQNRKQSKTIDPAFLERSDISVCSTGFLPHLPQLNTFHTSAKAFPAPKSLQSAVPLQRREPAFYKIKKCCIKKGYLAKSKYIEAT